jgi:hypothetical protein
MGEPIQAQNRILKELIPKGKGTKLGRDYRLDLISGFESLKEHL